ncbi:uncharacterized protein TA18775 [Theileria annulata]|uniref:BTB domain-containing protein n=1 Tax=Theileria annulata TaxID=5874 RepID=Q4UBD3_THEAN|nr:uncharacterized protein TA18775 [Theileria annulata]CAI75868.1 hypothetical protein TA18775 [Theileria annulata]|eukprot:XP_955344.1 hypothetical protein TA18775 [Theileria annulata]
MLCPLVNLRLSDLTGRADINDDYTDMLLVLRKPDNFFEDSSYDSDVVINVHSGVLRVASPYFNKAIDSLLEKKSKSNEDLSKNVPLQLVVDTEYPAVVKRIIYYIYKNDYQNMNEDPSSLIPLYVESARFNLVELKNSVVRLIKSQASLEDLANLASAAESAGELELAQECGRILSDSSYAIFSSDLYLKLGYSALKTLLQSDNIQLDEVQVFASLCHYLDSKKNLNSPYSSSQIGTKEKELIKHVRFCSMSPKSLSEFRRESVNTFLLDASLRILNKTQFKPRVFPWMENAEYKTICYNGLFPIMLVRVGKFNLSNLDHDSSNCRLVTPILDTKNQNDSYLAHTHGIYNYTDNKYNLYIKYLISIGVEREGCELFWAFKVSRTSSGRIGLGLTINTDKPLDELSRSTFSKMPKSRKVAFFYDFSQNKFKSGYIDDTSVEQILISLDIKNLWTYESNMNRAVYKLKTNDVVYIRVNVTSTCVNFTISVANVKFNEKFTIPVASKRTIGNSIRRAAILTSPFIVTYDAGDSLLLPELTSKLIVP